MAGRLSACFGWNGSMHRAEIRPAAVNQPHMPALGLLPLPEMTPYLLRLFRAMIFS